jgi:pimeloyl-ACP methyl ester carboxylesterase
MVIVAAWAGAAIALAAAAAAAAAPAVSAANRFPANRIAWSNCGPATQCGRVLVPLDWSRPRGRRITLAVARHLASGPGRRIGSLFINPGGPGGSGLAEIKEGGAGLDATFQGRFDIVSWDLRGSASSTHVRCFTTQRARRQFWGGAAPIPMTAPESVGVLQKTAAFTRRCRALTGELLAHISESDSARDLDYLRRLVGDSRLTFVGESAGTFLGQTYANMFPGRVRAMVLDGVINPFDWTASTESALSNIRSDSDLVFEKFLSTCQTAGPSRCALAGHGLVAARVDSLLARLKRGPIPAPTATPPRRLLYGDALVAITPQLDHPIEWPELASELEQAAAGDGSALATTERADLAGSRSASFEGTQGIFCADAPDRAGTSAWRSVIAHLTAVSKISGPPYGWSLWATCAAWGVHATGRYTGPWHARTSNPILVVDNRFDPSTPFANARLVSRLLGNAVLLTENGYGHVSSSDPSVCVGRAIVRYLIEILPPRRGTVCEANRQPFDPDFGKPLP